MFSGGSQEEASTRSGSLDAGTWGDARQLAQVEVAAFHVVSGFYFTDVKLQTKHKTKP